MSNTIESAGQGESLKVAERPDSALDRIGGDYINSTGWYTGGELYHASDDPMVERLRNVHASMHTGFAAIREALLVKDPQLTPEAHLVAVERKGQNWLNTIMPRYDAAEKVAQSEVDAINSAIRARVGTPTQHASEIRGYLRSLDAKGRLSVLEQATNDGDKATMAAMLDAPGYLSGLDAKQQEAFRNLYLERNAKDLLTRRSAVLRAIEINSKAAIEAVNGCAQFFDAKTIGAIVQESNKAAAARDAIDATLAG